MRITCRQFSQSLCRVGIMHPQVPTIERRDVLDRERQQYISDSARLGTFKCGQQLSTIMAFGENQLLHTLALQCR